MTDPLIIARDSSDLALLPALANRHGCITGATGTGKTISLQVLAEQFSRIGVPVFVADVKGDLSGIAKPGATSEKLEARLTRLKLPTPEWGACPTTFWDVFGEQGHPIRATISDMGPLVLSRLLNLNDTQEGVLTIYFRAADDNGLLLLNLSDLRAMLQFVGEHRRHPARPAAARGRGRGQLLRRADAEHRRPVADRGWPGRGEHPLGRPPDAAAPALLRPAALAPLGAVREPA